MRLALLAIPAVRSALSLEIGRDIEYHAAIASTQDRARALGAAGSGSSVVVADHQTSGQGTRGRSWDAPAGTSLLASWLFRPAPAEPGLFALLAGVAVARAVLPANVSRADAVFNIAHAAALLAAVLRSDGALLSIAMADRLHQPARAQLVTGLNDIIAAARGAGAFGAALSGAGPAVVAFAPARLAARVVAAMEESAHAVGTSGRGRVVRVRAAGAQVRRA